MAATNRDLRQLVREEKFRLDLYYRINVISIELPPLRMRKEDIPLLCSRFVEKFNFIHKKEIEGFTPETLSLMMSYSWPGNVRELENVTERAFVLAKEKWIAPHHLPEEITGGLTSPAGEASFDAKGISGLRKSAEKQFITCALEKSGYSMEKTSLALGIHRTTLYRKIKSLGIVMPDRNGKP